MTYDIADSVPIAWDVKDATGTLVNASTASLTVTRPDGTPETVTVPAPSVAGQYRVTYIPAVEGMYSWRSVTTVPNTAYEDVFTVRSAVSPAILSLADAKSQLNITSTTFDDQLRDFIESATEIIENYVGPVVRRTHTARVSGYYGPNGYLTHIPLPHTQVLAITGLTVVSDGSSPITLSDLTVDAPSGVMSYKSGASFPYREMDVTYTVGRTTVKANWITAAKIIVQHMWQTRLGNLPGGQGDDRGYVVTGSGYLVPYQAVGLLQPDEMPAGFA